MRIFGLNRMATNEKILNDIKIALSGNTNHTWNYIFKLLETLGHTPLDGDDRQAWAIKTARRLVE